MKFYAIIVAGGKGKRMQSALAKQFLLLNEKPVLMHTLQAFYLSNFQPEIILVLPENDLTIWDDLCVRYHFTIPHRIVSGGKERFNSVRNGLMTIKTAEAVVAIHDAVRPLASRQLIDNCFNGAIDSGNAIPYTTTSDSIRKISDKSSKIINRDKIVLIQTPQVFEITQLRKAYQQTYSKKFTDDASVVEKAGYPLSLIPGERNNLKITFTEDLLLASFLLKQGQNY